MLKGSAPALRKSLTQRVYHHNAQWPAALLHLHPAVITTAAGMADFYLFVHFCIEYLDAEQLRLPPATYS